MNNKKNKILIIDDDTDMCSLLSRLLTKKGYDTTTAHSGMSGINLCKQNSYDIVLCDYRLGDKDGREVLEEIKSINPQTIVLIITGYSDIKVAVEVIKMGAYDYISKPLIPDEVLNLIATALDAPADNITAPTKNGKPQIKQNLSNQFMIGNSPETAELYRQVAIVAPTDYSVILYGESGTGKEVIAKTIHDQSNRASKPFVALDCGTLSKELAGSELFGHVKGAFTGALADKEGHFEMAEGGTLFLDEVANLSPDVQASLLRVIQEKKFKRIGGNKEMQTDVRIIVASNENLQEAYRSGKFREDLYHRFNEFSIHLPPLRKRRADIPGFAAFFLDKTNQELNRQIEGFEDDVMDIFMSYSWPGNVREFRNVIRRAVLLTQGNKVNASILPWEIKSAAAATTDVANGAAAPAQNFSSATSAYSAAPATQVPLKERDLKNAAARAEYETIINTLKEVNFNKKKAAEILKIDRKTLYNKIKNYEESLQS